MNRAADVRALRRALRQVAQAHAWLAFGECRSFGAEVLLLSPSDADAVARVALGEYRHGPEETPVEPHGCEEGQVQSDQELNAEFYRRLVRAALVAEVAKTATDPGGQAWIPVQLTMEDEDDDWRPF